MAYDCAAQNIAYTSEIIDARVESSNYYTVKSYPAVNSPWFMTDENTNKNISYSGLLFSSLHNGRNRRPAALSTIDIIWQTLGGTFGGALSGVAVGAAAAWISPNSGLGDYGYFFGGALVGYSVGSSLIIYAIGNNDKRTASYTSVLLGNLIGVGIGSVIALTANINPVVTGVALVELPIASSIIAYNLTRRYTDNKVAITPSLIKTSSLMGYKTVPAVSFTIHF